ncbi:Protein arginine N-methyltransferase 7 (TbPRMT7) [Durusdinium trenchii]|uniref:Protein arginine N-methyltransferase 7 (TbPRMT7) n=1 Tax=Durusdinium trenchii TaxID=1381693 RepID=A0ABP0KYN7_9DINO
MMASDNKKYRSFQRAIQQSIEHWASLGEDTVVLEIGCGAYAPFARLCADEGAKQVYAVEGNTWAAERAARKVPANVQVFAGLSQQLPSEKLAPRPNVVVMETIGDWAANEFMVSTFLDASRRLCRPDTKWIPGQVRTCYVPVETPTWGCEIPPGLWLLGSDDQRSRLALSDVATLEFYDFNNFREEPMLLQERQANFTMNRSGELQGFLIWVEELVERCRH